MSAPKEVPGGDPQVVSLEGRLDVVAAAGVRARLAACGAAGCRLLVVDLAAVDFVDSSGLGALVAGYKDMRALGGRLRLAAPRPQALALLKLTTLDRVFTIFASAADALAAP